MKVFLSWSGNKSKEVAELTNQWLQCVLQSLTPWISTKDIDRGSLWFSQISDQLNDTGIGIIFLTQENKNNPWIMFESGALAKGLSSSRVCTFLVDLAPEDISNPLAHFNHTFPNKQSILYLVYNLNSLLGERGLEEKVLDRVFEKYWPDLEDGLETINRQYIDKPEEPERPSEDILKEILLTTRNLSSRINNIELESRERETRAHKRRSVSLEEVANGIKDEKTNYETIISILNKKLSMPTEIEREGPKANWKNKGHASGHNSSDSEDES